MPEHGSGDEPRSGDGSGDFRPGESYSEAFGRSMEMSYMLKGRSPWVASAAMAPVTKMEDARARSLSVASNVYSPDGSRQDVRVEGGDAADPFLRPVFQKETVERVPSADGQSVDIDPMTGEVLPDLEDVFKTEDGVVTLSTFWQSVFNSTNLLMGVGLLSLPYACKLSGWFGVVLLIFFSVVTNYTAKLLGKVMEYEPSVKLRNGPGAYTIYGFADMGMVAFGEPGRTFMWIVFVLETFGYACIYIIIESENLKSQLKMLDAFATWGPYEWMLLASLVFLPTMWLPNLSILSYFSAFGVIASVFLLIGVVIDGLTGAKPNGEWCKPPDCTGSLLNPSVTTLYKFDDLPIVIGLVMVGFAGHAVFPTIRTDMKDKREYNRMVDVTYVFVFLAYLGMCVAGYTMFGDSSQSEITLNLGKNIISHITVWIVISNPLAKYALDMSPITFGLESFFQVTFKIPLRSWMFTAVSLTLRTALVFFSMAIVIAIPDFAVLLGLLGSLCSFTISVSFPCACYLKLFWDQLGPIEKVWNIFLVVLGTMCAIVGTYAAATGQGGPAATVSVL
eukprot:CAMPEP_0206244964 /NCGR_PEP_ID=MMETSP0047_2-20121206/18445_1 /ASSEMBLY_ACC=CAM_ASM_000192 /TAXON_ID=195065 /ORGANISM="Chroomonas mesostigmatica_cf, Strain CCMP1168" /LENGTH=561 /DNA_ID=CAMNT_0053670233 /DNA_START=129 /DNA_END=1814 /DNA_ORIENTATION=+